MPEQLTGNIADLTLRLGGLEPGDVRVIELTGREGLNSLFEYTVQLSSWKADIDLDTILKSACTIEIAGGACPRYIHGIVRSFERLGEKGHYTQYTARVVPLHWLLTKRYGSRIFQAHNCPDMTVPGIIRKVLLDAGIPEDMVRFVLPREMPVHEYVVQYRETEFDFISRLMEEEGLACYFEHNESTHILVIGEAPIVFRPSPAYDALAYHEPTGLEYPDECIYDVRERRSVEYGAVGLTDWNFKKPGLGLWTRYPGGAPGYEGRATPPGPPEYEPNPPGYGPKPPGTPPYQHCEPRYEGRVLERYSADESAGGERTYSGPPAPPANDDYSAGATPPTYTGGRGGTYGGGGGYNGASSGTPGYGGNGKGGGNGSYPGGPSYAGNALQSSSAPYDGDPGTGSPAYAAPGYGGDRPSPGAPGYGGEPPRYGAPGHDGAPPAYGQPSYDGDSGKWHNRTYERCSPDGEPPATDPYTPDSGGSAYGPSYGGPDQSGYADPDQPSYGGYPSRPPPPPQPPYVPLLPPMPPQIDYGTPHVCVDYPGEYRDREYGQRLAQIRLEEHACAARVLEIGANARCLSAGESFRLKYHPNETLNGEYLATELRLAARQSQSTCEDAEYHGEFRFEAQVIAIPAGTVYRPRRITPRPLVRGAQTAIVVGPAHEEIYTDSYGRVKVQFHWDREGRYNEHSSCWIRVSHGSAGGGYGMMFLPRVGHEVIVDFLEGDPDRPIITGRVYNGDHTPPYALPEWKTRSSIKTQSYKGGGTNEIRFEDKYGYEQILVYAQRDYHMRCNANRVETVGGNSHTTAKYNRYDLTEWNHNNEVCLDLNEKIGGNKSLTVCGSVAEEFHANHSEKCGSYYLKAEKGGVVVESAADITFKVGGNFIRITPDAVYVVGTMVHINSGGAPGNGYLSTCRQPKPPWQADSARPGCAMGYYRRGSYGRGPAYKSSYTPGNGQPPPRTPDQPAYDQEERSWIEIELVDETGQPWPGEEYEITTPGGDVIRGTLDANGQAHVELPGDGECQVRFSNLDQAAWERA